MAKVRRVIRKVDPANPDGGDIQFWPVIVALCLLGGFLMGLALVYLDGHILYWPALLGLPVLTAGLIVGLKYISNRYLRRSMQLAMVVSVIANVLLIVGLWEYHIFKKYGTLTPPANEMVKERKARVINKYVTQNRVAEELQERAKADTPEPEPDKLEKKETKPEEQKQPKPQPLPVPKPEETPKPKIVKKEQPQETKPRQSETQSKLSRRTPQRPQPRSGMKADLPRATEQAQRQPQANQKVETQKTQNTHSPVQRRQVNETPQTQREATQVALNRRQQVEQTKPESTQAATLKRQVNDTPKVTPSTSVAVDTPPTRPRETDTRAQPTNPLTTKQQTTAPQRQKPTVDPVANTPTQIAKNTQRQQTPTETQPVTARSEQPSPQRAKTMVRPQLNNTAQVESAAPAQLNPSATPTQQPSKTQVTRNSPTTPTVPRAVSRPVTTPTSNTTADSRPTPRRQANAAQPTPTNQPTKSSPQRQQVANRPSPSTNVTVAAPSPTPSTNANPSSNAVAKAVSSQRQTSNSNPTATRSSSTANTPSTSTSVATPTNQPARRLPRAPSASNVATGPSSPQRRTTPTVTPSTSSTAANVTTSQGPQVASNPQPRATSAAVARNTANNTGATSSSQPSRSAPSRSLANQTPRPSTQRAASSDVASIAPQSPVQNTPARSQHRSNAPASPTAVESPAIAQTTTGAGRPSAEPTPLTVSKSVTGTAGAGRSENLDRAAPTASGAALAASNSARRSRSTQRQAGPAFAASESSRVPRSAADSQIPTATRKVALAEFAEAPGAQQTSTANATSSASTVDSRSNAQAGEISAARGTVEVDLGPTKLVADNAPANRASGGGQPEVNLETHSNQVARSNSGGVPETSLLTDTKADSPTAPTGGGGTPSTTELNIDATAAVRAESGGSNPSSGEPSSTQLAGPPSEVSSAAEFSPTSASRAEAAEAAPGDIAAGGGDPDDEEDEEERRRRLARTALAGTPGLSLGGPTTADLPASNPPAGGGSPARGQPTEAGGDFAATTSVAKQLTGGGSPAAGGPSATAAEVPSGASGGGHRAGKLELARAENFEAASGAPLAGGGSASPARAATGPAFQTKLTADSFAVAGGPSSGDADAPLVDARGLEASRLAGGAVAPPVTGSLGAVASSLPAAAAGGTLPGVAAGQRRAGPSTSGPALAVSNDGNQGAPQRRTSTTGLPGGATTADLVDATIGGGASSGEASQGVTAGSADAGELTRQTGGGLVLQIKAVEGPGGLSDEYAPDAGITSRRASRDSLTVRATADARFIRTSSGGRPSTNTSVAIATDAFEGRKPGLGKGKPGSTSPQTEAAIEAGLVFLKRHQSPDGSWSLKRFAELHGGPEYDREYRAILDSDTAATGLALLAFQGAGYHHLDYEYADTVSQAVRWLVENQQDNGDLYVRRDEQSSASVWLYSHSIAALALCEAYGMTKDPELREPAQKALDFIVKAQHKQRGGWRYAPGQSSDTSVTGWVFMAIYSARRAELNVPDATFKGVNDWLDRCQKSRDERHLYRYNPDAPDTEEQRHGRKPNNTMTAVGLLMRMYMGWSKDNPHIQKGADFLNETLPAMGTERRVRYAHLSPRDSYYWYYATQVLAHVGGDAWQKWHDRLRPILLQSQVTEGPMAGSWDPIRPTVDRWGPHAGRLYVTTLNLLSLEVRFRLLPLYEETASLTSN